MQHFFSLTTRFITLSRRTCSTTQQPRTKLFVIQQQKMSSEAESYRSFSAINDENVAAVESLSVSKIQSSLTAIRNDIVGGYNAFTTPFGQKPIIYADWTASGRPVDKIEKYLLKEVMPFYGNTHTAASITGHQSTCFRHEARQIVAESVNAKVTGKAAEDVVIFTGNGTTAAVNKLVDALGLNLPLPLHHDISKKPVVFVSSYEHHSNLLPWRESVADVVTIAYDAATGVNLVDLERQLLAHKDRLIKIGAFSAASNVTGVCTAVDDVSILLHQHHALAVFDYATAAPYVKMDMNPVLIGNPHSGLAYKDAIYFSGHKFLGGPGCPGVLVAKRKVMPQSNESPSSSSVGGGTVFYVTEQHHRYLSNREEREEGGTPYVLGDVKLGLVMNLKQSIRASWIEQEEFRISSYVLKRLQSQASIVLLGKPQAADEVSGRYLPIFSFLIRCGGKFLHFHFVAALLNDLFGVQCRGGCMCAGPFSQILLGITDLHNQAFEQALLNRHEVLRPGYTRLSFPYWMSPEEIDYIVEAVLFVAEHGAKFLPAYRYNHMTGEWAHTTRLTRFPERKWLSHFSLSTYLPEESQAAPATTPQSSEQPTGSSPASDALKVWGVASTEELLKKIRSEVQAELRKVEAVQQKASQKRGTASVSASAAAANNENLQSFEYLRWFVNAEEAVALGAAPLSELQGPIQPPASLSGDASEPSLSISSAGTAGSVGAASAFAVKRDRKFLAHTGNEDTLPRYVTLDTSVRHAVAAAPTTTSAASISVVQKEVKPAKVLGSIAETAVQALGKVNGEEKGQQSSVVDDDAALTCATGTCSFRPRVPAEGTITDGNGKILSGAGRTYENTLITHPTAGAVKAKPIVHLPNKKIMKAVGQAIKDWGMIEDGDRLLLGLSGGKDSLALLHILLAVQKRAPVKFEIACATVDPQTDSFDPSPLIPYVQSLGITYHYLSEPIVELAKSKLQGDSLCAFCSRFKRGLLYSCCRTNKYNKLVLAQHLDDLVESFLMSALHNGQVRTMKANYKIEAGDVRVIRPLIYVREHMTRDFSQQSKLPIINENCPACFEQPKERDRMKKLMAQEETMVPNLFYNLKRALMPLLHDDTYVAMAAVTSAIEENANSAKIRAPFGGSTKRNATAVTASADGTADLSGKAAAAEGNHKRPKVEASSATGSAEVTEGAEMEVAEEEDGPDDEPLPVCGADGGYCPPCYELA